MKLVVFAAGFAGLAAWGGLLLVLIVPLAWLFGPFHDRPPAGRQAVAQTYLPLERAAEERACHGARPGRCRGAPLALVQAVIMAESGGQAVHVGNGGLGLMGIAPRAMAGQSPLDPATNLDFGVRRLDRLYRALGGHVRLCAAAYRAGLGAVSSYLAHTHGGGWAAAQAFAPLAVRSFVARTMRAYAAFATKSKR